MNISELARRLKITIHELRAIIPLLGFDVGSRAIKVDQKVAQEILTVLSNIETLKKYQQQVAREPHKDDAPLDESPVIAEGVIEIPEQLSVKQFAEIIQRPVTKVILLLMKNGVMAAQNELIDFETASILAQDLGFTTTRAHAGHDRIAEAVDVKKELEKAMVGKSLEPRPPVVVVMGHVDHGKTTLLDSIRQAHIVEKEAGGITQHIGAYQVEKNGRKITFIDTPGHEAFTAMRSRGAKIADIAILVVAADDGVQPQTIEALSHIQRAGIPFVVAINKIDKEDANPEKIQTALSDVGVISEAWGGSVPFVKISAKKLLGMDELLDVVLLVADLHKNTIVADYHGSAMGSVIEAHVDKGEGPVATVLVQSGILHKNDLIVVGGAFGKAKSMRSESGKILESARPSNPVRLLGLKSLPAVGDLLRVVRDEEWKAIARGYKKIEQAELPSLFKRQQEESGKYTIPLIVKADFLGSLEALKEAFEIIEKEGVRLVYHRKGLGVISEVDVELASQTQSIILGFNIESSKEADILARDRGVMISTSRVIYDLVDIIQRKADELLGPKIMVKEKGTVVVKQVFRQDKKTAIMGCFVQSGIIRKGGKYQMKREGKPSIECDLIELQAGKQPVTEVAEGSECGMKIKIHEEVLPGDELVYSIEEVRQRK